MTNVMVLGAGLVGGPMAIDLARDGDKKVTVCDIDNVRLAKLKDIPNIFPLQADLKDPGTLSTLVSDQDFIVSAVPGYMGFDTLRHLIEAGRNVIDIAFFPEDLFHLDELARKKGVTVISDIGVAPGMSNILVGYANHQLDRTTRAITYVGGLPKVREWPYEYKAGFSPIDVIEEYTRPARYIENGREVIKPALSDPELIDFEGIGTLEAFNSDGLRSLAKTIHADYMIEKTLRYPGHVQLMKVLRETGFFSKEELDVNGKKVVPLELTTKLLFPKWELKQGEEDITVMKIIVEGIKNGEGLRYTWDLLDRYDHSTAVHSMARTTGYTATMALRMVASGLYDRKGVSAPEYIGNNPGCVSFILDGLRKRNVKYIEKVENINTDTGRGR